MTIKIEFDSVYDLENLLSGKAEALVRAERMSDDLYRARNEISDLKEKLADMAKPLPIPVSTTTVKELLGCFSNDNFAQTNRIMMIKCVRIICGLGLKDAKDLVDAVVPYNRSA